MIEIYQQHPIVCAVVFFAIYIFIIREIFSIPKMLRQQKAQTKLLALMAKNQGIEPEKIEEIITTSNKTKFDKLNEGSGK